MCPPAWQFQERSFQLRTLSEHKRQCDTLENDDENYSDNSKEFGVNFRSTLLELEHFNLCSGALIPDVMHDLLEGVLQYEEKCLLKHCIDDCHYFSLSYLSRKIENIELGYMEADDRPTPLTSRILRSSDNSLGQKGTFSVEFCSAIANYCHLH